MAIISEIKSDNKDINKVHIYVDGEYFKSTLKEISFNLNLYSGKKIDRRTLNRIIVKEDTIKCKNKALQIINGASQSEKNLKYKLQKYGFEENIINSVINSLKEYNLIDDQRLANSIIKDKRAIKKFGKNMIYYELLKKGIDKDLAQNEIDKLEDKNIELENAIILARKKINKIKDEENNKKFQKLARHLSYKGFEYDIIKKAISKVMNTDYNDY
ncbi:regulatory protein RecX [Clostridium sp. D2Q-14]|uniref:regulatory protein RecX n=1 Tax=Anaeromonas gelatinilytica TaxID=2683194 RepID=UPI00193BA60F|nr:regulatory protein RecX [Anaeromonas gelatinilytica]MBS4534826.1 regulatory protein RecX [Anaeromonas gelatinilytica]